MSAIVMKVVNAFVQANWTHSPIRSAGVEGSVPQDNTAFLAIQYPLATEEQITVGAPGQNVWREAGGVRIVLSVPIGTDVLDDAEPWMQRIDDLRAALRGKNLDAGPTLLGPIRLQEASPPVTNDGNDLGAYYEVAFVVTYQADVLG